MQTGLKVSRLIQRVMTERNIVEENLFVYSFWNSNILSASKFRDKFQTLYLKTYPAENLNSQVVNADKQRRRNITANVLDIDNTDW